jgi:hypothetical protein
MRRNFSVFVAGSIALLAAAACSDAPSAPTSASRSVSTVAPSLDRGGKGGLSNSATFVLTKKGGVFNISIPVLGDGAAFTLTVPANAVCRASDAYANADWNASCQPDHADIQVTATYYDHNGVTGIDFSPELRFDPAKTVTISTNGDRDAIFAMELLPKSQQSWGNFVMLYTPDGGLTLINDAATDPSLITHIDLRTGIEWRRIKHFSGYTGGTGLSCDPLQDPTCATSFLLQ